MSNPNPKPLPDGWRWVRLADVCEAVRGVTFPSGEGTSDKRDESIACLTTSGVQAEVAWESRQYISTRFLANDAQYLRVGDILVSTANSKALVGKSCIVRSLPEPATLGAFVTALRLKPDTSDLRYVSSYLRSPDAMDYFFIHSSNTTNISNLRVSELLELKVPLPPFSEQRRIATRLNEIMAEIARARAAAEVALDAANKLTAAQLSDAFANAQSTRWREMKIGQICKRRTEIVHPRDGTKGKLRFVGLEHVEPDTGQRIGETTLDAEALDGRKPRFYEGDVIYGYLRPYLNKVWVAEFDGVSSVDQYAFAVNPDLADPKFVAYYLRSPVYLRRAPINFTPGFLPRIRSEEVEGTPIPVPPLDEQRRVVARLDERRSAANQSRAAVQTQLDAINALPAVYLRRAFNGEL